VKTENFKNTKTSKTSQIPLGPEYGFECDFSRVIVSGFPSGDRKAKTSQTLTLEKAASKLFLNFGKKICETKSALPYNISQSRPCFSHALKSFR
jgi:hypothetical protein